jgi:hypothetical protein
MVVQKRAQSLTGGVRHFMIYRAAIYLKHLEKSAPVKLKDSLTTDS